MRFNSLQAWLSWQESLHPSAIDMGLDRIQQVYQALDLNLQQRAKPIITVAGSNGKGSCVAYLNHMLSAMGYRVGSYSSPHLFHYRERIQVSLQTISDEELMLAFDQVDRARADISLTYFEFGTLAAFCHFQRQACDCLVLEVGLGGRLDAVNILDPDIALISSISMDHMDWLGDTREQIAAEKAGILRPGKAFVCGEPDPPQNLLELARMYAVDGYYIDQDFSVRREGDSWYWNDQQQRLGPFPPPRMSGEFQLRNLACVIQCLRLVGPKVEPKSKQAPALTTLIRDAASKVTLPGRLQQLSEQPLCLADVAHNEAAVTELARFVETRLSLQPRSQQGKVFAVFAMLQRKDVNSVIAVMQRLVDTWYVSPLREQQSFSAEQIRAALPSDSRCFEFGNVVDAWRQAKSNARENDIVLVFGSFYTVMEVLNA